MKSNDHHHTPSPKRGWLSWNSRTKNNNEDGSSDDGGGDGNNGSNNSRHDMTSLSLSSSLLHVAGYTMRSLLAVTVVMYALNQKQMLNRPLSAFVSKTLFWPTLPITLSRRIGKWVTQIDDTVVLGGAPFSFMGMPSKLYEDYGVRGVINMCEEFRGPLESYKRLGMEELYLPTTDHFEPSFNDLITAVDFIKRFEARGEKVYVHCRAGHGRSAAVVFSWLLYNNPFVDPRVLNASVREQRNIRKTLWKQPNIQKLHTQLVRTGMLQKEQDEGSAKDASDFEFSDSSDVSDGEQQSTEL